ncbi:PQQ-binding-like beta-propeller repeat protein [Carboxylicivirga mesophila]|uniref:PQQ-binding-like beta-propeller repeat protein n=1 Tax=Carboxylicivirga mesophila TaxID=1166478 RepID=A0ABS5KDW3_9BACT|nr:PQQ-binding-like beta-propeller repeat protein [Carboxylicivirga mesophila]MBS2212678.1 PQQ-binding-like beta-propeller repeat protein [Carboxylicivirga mesophila]
MNITPIHISDVKRILLVLKMLFVKKLFVLVVLVLSAITSEASYTGRVLLDISEDAHIDKMHTGLEGVCVSDGLHVVKSDADGYYTLPGAKISRFIYITVPSGYKVVGTHYILVAEEKRTYDFTLQPYKRTLHNARFIQLADTETGKYSEWITDVKAYAANYDVGFIVHTGDVCYEDGLNFHAENVNSDSMGVPVYYCVGNHDLVKGDYGEQLFENLFGPPYYSFDAGNTHFIVTPMAGGDAKPSYTAHQIFEWMKNDLAQAAPDKNLVVFNHDLLTFGNEFILKGKNKQRINLSEHHLKAWIYGHWHINFMKKHGEAGPVSVCASTPDKGGIDHSPSNFLVYDINHVGDINVTPRYTFVNQQFSVVMSNALLASEGLSRNVSVNSYCSKAHVRSVEGVITDSQGNRSTISFQQNTDWNWSAVVSDSIRLGKEHSLYVAATFDDTTCIGTDVVTAHTNQGLSIKWLSNLQSNTWMARPLMVDNKVYVTTIDDFGMEKSGVHALDANSGKKLWSFKSHGSVKNSICYSKGMILCTDHFGTAYALDASDGQLVWEKQLGQRGLGAFVSGSVVKDGIYYTGFGNYLKAIDVESGDIIWENNAWSGGEGNTATMSVVKDVLVTGSNWKGLFVHHAAAGEVLWQMSELGFRFRSSSATCQNDTLFVASEKGIGLFNLYTGNLYQYIETPYDLQVATKPIIYKGLIIVGTSKDGLVAFDMKNGQEVWKVKCSEALFYTAPYSSLSSATVESAPELINEEIYFGASDGYLYRIQPHNGTVIQKINIGAPILSPVAPCNKGFILSDFGGSVYRFHIN